MTVLSTGLAELAAGLPELRPVAGARQGAVADQFAAQSAVTDSSRLRPPLVLHEIVWPTWHFCRQFRSETCSAVPNSGTHWRKRSSYRKFGFNCVQRPAQ